MTLEDLSQPRIFAPSVADARHRRAVYGMFFLSGMGALIFETVWFSQIGLTVGNSVWSAALVIAAFMAGLALGNAAAVLLARRWINLVRGYGIVEVVAAVSGAAVVLAIPYLPYAFRPLLAPFLDEGAVLGLIRLGIAFGLMVIPAIALGATLPLLSRPLEAAAGNYGSALGRLYGVNTLGAVAGTLIAELLLVPALGLRNSGLVAAVCNLSAALIAFWIAKHAAFGEARPPEARTRPRFDLAARRTVAAAFLSGGVLLALEVIWFRFLLLSYESTTLMFAIMLAAVLSGVGLGGVIASRWSRRGWTPGRVARLAAAGAAVAVVAGYAAFGATQDLLNVLQPGPLTSRMTMSLFLMAPVCLLSGLLFTALGDCLRARMVDAADATATLTFANTLGAMGGSLLAAFALLPALGVEGSLFLLALLYGVIAILVPGPEASWSRRLAPALVSVVALALFPFRTMEEVYFRRVETKYSAQLVAAREGVAQTAFYLARPFLGEPLYYQLATDGYSMTSTHIWSDRYQRLFAYLPAAFHPRIERVLVICFGVGSTVSAVTRLPDVRTIDVVEVSRDILEMSDIVYPDARSNPLRDGRVTTRVEDGRFFLQQTERGYDLITGEPPPPNLARVVSLYTREYFELMRTRLNPGGIATYWLPVHQLQPPESLSIIRAFCDAFEDCSLWSGFGLDWILMGSRGGIAPVSPEGFSRLWAQPETASELRRIGIDTPEQLVAQFLADASVLQDLTEHALPLLDNFPHRIHRGTAETRIWPLYARLMNAGNNRKRLEASPWISGILPPSLIRRSEDRFLERQMLETGIYAALSAPDYSLWRDLAVLLDRPDPPGWVSWLLGSERRMAEIAARRGPHDPIAAEHLAIDALVHRRQPERGMTRERFLAMTPKRQVVTVFHHCLAGQQAEARSLAKWMSEKGWDPAAHGGFLRWVHTDCVAGEASQMKRRR